MIIVKLTGGLGNQLFQYACGRALAESNRSLLKLDTGWLDSTIQRGFTLDRFNISASIASDLEINIVINGPNNLWGSIMNKFQRLKPYYTRRIVRERTLFFDPKILKVPKDVYLEGYWASPRYFTNIQEILRRELTLVDEMDSINQEYAQRIQNENSVSLHIRRGDYLREQNQSIFGVLPKQYYMKAIQHITEKTTNPCFYIFSDDIAWCKHNLVIDFDHIFVTHNGIKADYLDLMLMSCCHHHIIANSTFSWWGAWLSKRKKGHIIIAPRKWYTNTNYCTRDFVPNNWVKL